MARPSLPAAIAPFRGCPAGCLRVACETLLSASAQKGRMNNGPRQALALNNPSLRFALCLTFSIFKSNHKLFPQNPQIFLSIQYHPSTTISFNINHFLLSVPLCFCLPSYHKTFIWFPIHCSLPKLFPSPFLETLRQTLWIKAKGSMKRPTFFWVLRTPFDPPIAPNIKTWVTHPSSPRLTKTIVPCLRNPCWIFIAWKRLNSENGLKKKITGLINSLFVRDKITIVIFTTHWKQQK